MTRCAALALLLLAGCSESKQLWSRSEIEGMAEEVALDHQADTSGLGRHVAALEQRIADLEAENRMQRAKLDLLDAESDLHDDNIGRLFSNDDLWRQHFTFLRAQHGLPPLPEPKTPD